MGQHQQAAAAMPNRATAAGSGVARPTGPQLQQLMHEHMNLQMMMRMQASGLPAALPMASQISSQISSQLQ
eukprot:scaffold21868_cov78-Phaeocystis_antarctica.AAC.1